MSPKHFGENKKLFLKKSDFIEKTQMCDLNFKLYEDTKLPIIGMIGL